VERWEAIAKRVDGALRYADMTQQELEEEVEFSRSTLNRRREGTYEWEDGQLYEISKATGVPLWFLTDGWEGWVKSMTPDQLRNLADSLPDD
jgi:hypothetical protein